MIKPKYQVPCMKNINAINGISGLKIVSTFSGCGGSCLGFKMAGYKVLWANEFVPAAQETYRLNHPWTMLDTRDIRNITHTDILKTIKMSTGEIDVLEGSPPCAAFSTNGQRDRQWGKIKNYSDKQQRVDDLFFEYARILKGLQPKVFVAENVSGLVKGVAKGYFKIILKTLMECGYNVEARLLNALWLGVPQTRERIIFIGVRNDINKFPEFPKPLPYYYNIGDAWENLNLLFDKERQITSRMSNFWSKTKRGGRLSEGCKILEGKENNFNRFRLSYLKPSPTITTSPDILHPDFPQSLSIAELKRICSFPDDFIFTGSYKQQWERMGRSVPPVMMYYIAKTIKNKIFKIGDENG